MRKVAVPPTKKARTLDMAAHVQQESLQGEEEVEVVDEAEVVEVEVEAGQEVGA
jgi:hypothetical protein